MDQKNTTNLKQRGAEKLARIPIKIEPSKEILRKPDWIRIRIPASPAVANLKKILRDNKLVTVCEEASCPTSQCFSMNNNIHDHG